MVPKSLLEHFKDVTRAEWDYYHPYGDDTEIGGNPFFLPYSKTKHTKFVTKYFWRAGKGKALEIKKHLPGAKFNEERMHHTNSIFFLGILLQKHCFTHPDWLTKAEPGYGNFPFKWFLTCLFHDAAFTLEKDRSFFESSGKSWDGYISQMGIHNLLTDTNVEGINTTLFNSARNYFDYRISTFGKYDHGIIGALYLYDRLVKVQKEKSQNAEGMWWDESLIPKYQEVCSAILTHNIWIPNQSNISVYRDAALDDLIDQYKPLSFKEWPFLYLLGIVDTIDPIKALARTDVTANTVLKNISLSLNENVLKLAKKEGSNLAFHEITDRACSLPRWLKTEISYGAEYLDIKLF